MGLLVALSAAGCGVPFEAAPPMNALLHLRRVNERAVATLSLSSPDVGDCMGVSGEPTVNGVVLTQDELGGWESSNHFGLPTRSCQWAKWSSSSELGADAVLLTFESTSVVMEVAPVAFSMTVPSEVRMGEPIVGQLTGDFSSGIAVEYLGEQPMTDSQLLAERSDDGREVRVTTPAVAGRYRLSHRHSETPRVLRCEGFARCVVSLELVAVAEFELLP